MEQQVDRLCSKTWTKFREIDPSRRFLVALSGIPGSGKTTVAARIASGLNELHHSKDGVEYAPGSDPQPDVALVVPLDGYHLTRAQLRAMPNAEEAAFRRGAAFTFDAAAYLTLVKKLREPLRPTTDTIFAPSFDHALKDPVENDVPIPPSARILIFEGLYTALDREGWRDGAKLMDELWFVDCPLDIAEGRVAMRNFAAGLTETYEQSVDRTKKSDMRNAREIVAEILPINETIQSIVNEEWKTDELREMEQKLEG